MDRKSLSFLALGLLIGVLLTSAALIPAIRARDSGDGRERRTVLKLGHVLDQQHPVHLGMEFMAKRLDALSGGTVELQIFPGGQLGTEPETIEQLQRGALAMVKTSTAAMEGFVPEMAVFSLPYLFRDEEHYWRVLNGPLGRELLAAGERHGIHGLCYYDSGSRSFYTLKKPILKPADVKEMKLRVLPSRTARDFIIMLGGGPTPVPWGELYTALQQGMVDGAENNPPSFLSSRHYEIAKHFSLDEHTRIPDMVIFSKPIWESLSPEVRNWVNEAATESVDFQRKLWREKTEEALKLVSEAGVTVYRPDKAAFVAATAPMYAALDDRRITELVRRIRDVP
ncbi:MAG TPA: TRAP transporter substrate-binding protein [Thermoanaerobaculia bacterium]|nr:TRAP transporter substrate-binding protein [Thermoanaerobaculia bacterium]